MTLTKVSINNKIMQFVLIILYLKYVKVLNNEILKLFSFDFHFLRIKLVKL